MLPLILTLTLNASTTVRLMSFLQLLQIPTVIFLDRICQRQTSLYLGLTHLLIKYVKTLLNLK